MWSVIISLFRNGFCVVDSLSPDSVWYKAQTTDLGGYLQKDIPLITAAIALLQLYAALKGTLEGMEILFFKHEIWDRKERVLRRLAAAQSKVFAAVTEDQDPDVDLAFRQLRIAAERPLRLSNSLLLPLADLLIGFSFGVLFFNSLGMVDYPLLVHALAIAEMSLIVILIAQHSRLGERRARHARALKVCTLLGSKDATALQAHLDSLSAPELEEVITTICANLPRKSLLAFDATKTFDAIAHPSFRKRNSPITATVAYVEHAANALRGVRTALFSGPANSSKAPEDAWHAGAAKRLQVDRWLQGLDFWILLLNWIAFVGYLAICATYYYEAPEFYEDVGRSLGLEWGPAEFIWYGNFAGDFAWTVEPATILFRSSFAG